MRRPRQQLRHLLRWQQRVVHFVQQFTGAAASFWSNVCWHLPDGHIQQHWAVRDLLTLLW